MPENTVYYDGDNLYVPRGFLNDSGLSWTARGVLHTAMTLKGDDPDGYRVDATHLAGFSTTPAEEVAGAIEELQASGYVGPDGRLAIEVLEGEPPR